MNKDRRAKLDTIYSQLEDLRSELETLKEEEREYYDNMPESFQNGEKGEKAQEAIDAMDNADNAIGEALENIDAAKGE